jgi:hypothetical protein
MVGARGRKEGKPVSVAKVMTMVSRTFKPDVSRKFWRWIRK